MSGAVRASRRRGGCHAPPVETRRRRRRAMWIFPIDPVLPIGGVHDDLAGDRQGQRTSECRARDRYATARKGAGRARSAHRRGPSTVLKSVFASYSSMDGGGRAGWAVVSLRAHANVDARRATGRRSDHRGDDNAQPSTQFARCALNRGDAPQSRRNDGRREHTSPDGLRELADVAGGMMAVRESIEEHSTRSDGSGTRGD